MVVSTASRDAVDLTLSYLPYCESVRRCHVWIKNSTNTQAGSYRLSDSIRCVQHEINKEYLRIVIYMETQKNHGFRQTESVVRMGEDRPPACMVPLEARFVQCVDACRQFGYVLCAVISCLNVSGQQNIPQGCVCVCWNGISRSNGKPTHPLE